MTRPGRSAGPGAVALLSAWLGALWGAVVLAQSGMPAGQQPAGAARPAPNTAPATGQVVLGSQSRIVVEPVEDVVQVFYLLDISNTGPAPVNPSTPFVFDMPSGATGTTILDGSSPLATADGPRVTVLSPIPTGHTFVQVACELSASGGSLTVTQAFPAAMEQLSLVVRKVGNATVSSPMITTRQEMPSDGVMYIAAGGGAVAAGQPITFSVTGIPHHSTAPRTVALALAAVIIGIGVWGAGRAESDSTLSAAEHKRLTARRDRLFNDLVRLENDRRNGRGDPRRFDKRREELVSSLEQLYGALDDFGAVPEPGSRAGLPASLDRGGAV